MGVPGSVGGHLSQFFVSKRAPFRGGVWGPAAVQIDFEAQPLSEEIFRLDVAFIVADQSLNQGWGPNVKSGQAIAISIDMLFQLSESHIHVLSVRRLFSVKNQNPVR